MTRLIADLPDFWHIVGKNSADKNFPEEWSDLFAHPEWRVLRNGDAGIVLFRNRDLIEVASNSAVGGTPTELSLQRLLNRVYSASLQRLTRNLVFVNNPPSHAAIRQVFAAPLMPKTVASFASLARDLVDQLIEEHIGAGPIDFFSRVSARLTARFWGALLGLTQEAVNSVPEHMRSLAPVLQISKTPEEIAALDGATARYLDLVSGAIDGSLERGATPLLQSMVALLAQVSDEAKPDPIGVIIAANLFDAFHTAAVGNSNVIFELLRSPSALAAVRTDPSLVSNAVAEGLRLSPSFILTDRCALTDLELLGVSVPSGTSIGMLWAAGNRDPAAFENPDSYQLLRTNRRETTFGGGTRICPGRFAARMLAQVTLDAVLSPHVRVELSGEPPAWISNSVGRQLSHYPVVLTRV